MTMPHPDIAAAGTTPYASGAMRLEKIISGGQTGVDRAALDAALEVGLPIGGWCPRGRRAEDGFVPHGYPLAETPTSEYTERTNFNVRDSDATLVITRGALDGGSLFTTKVAVQLGRPYKVVDMDETNGLETAVSFIRTTNARVINIAGPRESKDPGIYDKALAFLVSVFRAVRESTPA
jgi:hypothetical protein